MAYRCTAAPRRVFSLFYFCDTKTQKITKNARDLLYLCVINFFHEQKKTQFFKKKNLDQNRYSYTLNQNRHERFSSRKKTRKKTCKKHVFGIWMGPKNASKIIIFSSKMSITFSMQTLYFSPLSICKWSKNDVQKSFIFHSKFMFFHYKIIVFFVLGA